MYRTIDTSTWFDPKIKSLEPDGKLLFVYLFSNSHGHVSGIYYLPVHLIAHETGIKEARVNTLLDTLFALSLVVYDRVSEVVWVKKMFDHQGKGRLNDMAASKHLGTLHNCRLIKDFLEFYSHRQIPYRYRIEGYSPQEQEQKQEQEQDLGSGVPDPLSSHDDSTSKTTSNGHITPDEFVERWNRKAASKGLPSIQKLTDDRRRKLKTRLANRDWFETFVSAFQKLPLAGDWQPDFDWFIANGTNALKVAEGKYDWLLKKATDKAKQQPVIPETDQVVSQTLEQFGNVQHPLAGNPGAQATV